MFRRPLQLAILLFVISGWSLVTGQLVSGNFLRGDANNDQVLDISDSIYITNFLFLGGPQPACRDALDANDDGWINMADSFYLTTILFLGGSLPPAPHPVCGADPTADELGCQYSACP